MNLLSLFQTYAEQVESVQLLMLMVNVIVHLFFAGAVARDAGQIHKLGRDTALVTGYLWAFATLVGGVFVAIGYWFVHHSNLTHPVSSKRELR